MLAPRRIGKTVILHQLRDSGGVHGFRGVVLDVEGYRDEKAFFRKMCATIQEEIGVGQAVMAALTARLKRVVRGASEADDWRSLLLSTDWAEFADHLLAQLNAAPAEARWLLLGFSATWQL
jgi:hypothetical protein